MKEKSKLLRKIVRLQKEEKLIPKGCSLLVAFSGGIDSVVLCDALLELRGFLSLERLALAHFNHLLRGEESFRDESFCLKFAEERGLELFVDRKNVKEEALKRGSNLEETARELRYGFLREIKSREGFDLIATAHHLNDLLETSLIWFTRGAVMDGLIGFEPKHEDIVRPLYLVTKEEIRSYAECRNLRWVEDSSNSELSIYRNRIRHKVVPLMKEINPNLEETLLRMREVLKAENEFMNKLAEEVLERAKLSDTSLSVSVLRAQEVALQRRVIRRWTGLADFRKIEQVRRLLSKGGEVHIGSKKKVIRRGKSLSITTE